MKFFYIFHLGIITLSLSSAFKFDLRSAGDESKESCGFSGYCGDGYCCKFTSGCFCSSVPCRELCSNGFNGHKFVNLFLETEKKLAKLLKESGEKEVMEKLQSNGITQQLSLNSRNQSFPQSNPNQQMQIPQNYKVDDNGIGNFNPNSKSLFISQNQQYNNQNQNGISMQLNGYQGFNNPNYQQNQYLQNANRNNIPNTMFSEGKVTIRNKETSELSEKAKSIFSSLHSKLKSQNSNLNKNSIQTQVPSQSNIIPNSDPHPIQTQSNSLNATIPSSYTPIGMRSLYVPRKSKAQKKKSRLSKLKKSTKNFSNKLIKKSSQKNKYLRRLFKRHKKIKMLRSALQKLTNFPLKTASLDKASFKNLPFKTSWNNYVQSFDLRMWYLRNGVDNDKRMNYVHELNELHHELNYQWSHMLLKRFAIFYSIVIVYGYFFIQDYPIDWSDRHDEKFKNKVYGDMENSGGLEEEED